MGRVLFSQGYGKPVQEDSLIDMPPKTFGTHMINLRRIEDCVNLVSAQWF